MEVESSPETKSATQKCAATNYFRFGPPSWKIVEVSRPVPTSQTASKMDDEWHADSAKTRLLAYPT
jgi:hypothetical protein